jgi:hypothetical protein
LVRTRLSDATSAAEKYLEQLSVTENRLERLKSETVQKLGMKPLPAKAQVEAPVNEEEPSNLNGNHTAKAESSDQPLTVRVHLYPSRLRLISMQIL